jgi:glutamine amidotransferase PdxT
MKDKRTYDKLKEHGEDMSHENESKIDTSPIQLLTEQYRSDLKQYQEREGLYIKTENQLKATKAIVIEMSTTIRKLHTENENFQAEIARLNEEIQLLEMKIKK